MTETQNIIETLKIIPLFLDFNVDQLNRLSEITEVIELDRDVDKRDRRMPVVHFQHGLVRLPQSLQAYGLGDALNDSERSAQEEIDQELVR